MRPPVRWSRRRDHTWFHLLTAFLLLFGVAAPFAPIATVPAAAAPAVQDAPPLPAPVRVAVVGSFQTAIGCAADYDPNCPAVALADTGGGTWSAVLPVPPGEYTFRVFATSDIDRSLGQGGDPDATDLRLSVPGDATGVFFAYDSLSGEITADPVSQQAILTTDVGGRYAMAPARSGGYEVYFDAQAGSYGFQVFFGEQPVAQDAIALDFPSRVRIAVDDVGTVVVRETVPETVLTVAKVDGSGTPLPGACFSVRPRGESLVGQRCDTDDGQSDGFTRLRFPNGVPPGSYMVAEVSTPDGQAVSEDQQIDLGPGEFSLEMSAGEADTPEVTEPSTDDDQPDDPDAANDTDAPDADAAPGRVLLRATNEDGNRLPGACFAIIEIGFELCDDNDDGDTVFDGVPPGFYTVVETRAPAGFNSSADTQIDVGADGDRFRVTHESTSADEPDPVATEPPDPGQDDDVDETGSLAVSVRDDDGEPLEGACFALVPRDGGPSIEQCGEGGGELRFADVPVGRYSLEETRTPEGAEPVESQNVQVAGGQATVLTVSYAVASSGLGRLVLLVEDETGAPVGQTCFALTGAAAFDDICDQGDDGRLNIPDIPAGDYTVRQLQTDPAFDLADDQTVTVPEGDTAELTFVNPRPSAPEPATGTVVIRATGADGDPATGGCYAVTGATTVEVCDDEQGDTSDDPGVIRITEVAPGAYQVAETRAAGGVAPAAAAQPIQVVAGESSRVNFAAAAAPSPEPTEPATEQPGIQSTVNGRLQVVVSAEDGGRVGDVCVTLTGPETIGPVCDNDGTDANNELDRIVFPALTPGDYRLSATVPDEFSVPDEQSVSMTAGETIRVDLTIAAATPAAGTLVILTEGAGGEALLFACYSVENRSGTFGPFCDQNGNGDVVLTNVTPGEQQIVQTTAPEGAGPPSAAAQTVTVEAGSEATLTFSHGVDAGTLRIVTVDGDGDPVAGACYEATGQETYAVCDGGNNDAASGAGITLIEGVAPGPYTVVETRAAAGFEPAGTTQPTVVTAGEVARLQFTVTAEAPTGDLLVLVTADGQLLPGGCVTLDGPVSVGPICDEQTALTDVRAWRLPVAQAALVDVDARGGRILIEGLPVGDYTVTVTDLPAEFVAPDPFTVTVTADETVRADVPVPPATPVGGRLTIFTEDGSGQPLGGACYTVTNPRGVFGPFCDENGNGDVILTEVTSGDKEITQTAAPAGAGPVAEATQTLTIDEGGEATVTFVHGAALGAIEIITNDSAGNLAPGACYEVSGPNIGAVCDGGEGDTDPDAGFILFEGLPPGDYGVAQTSAAAGYEVAPEPQQVTVTSGATASVEFITEPLPRTGSIQISAVDANGDVVDLLPGACYGLSGPEAIEPVCDNEAGDTNPDPGTVRIENLAPGVTTLNPTRAPAGYATPAPVTLEVVAGELQSFELPFESLPPAAGTLVVVNVASDGAVLGGGCFVVTEASGGAVGDLCDNGARDGDADPGVIDFGGFDAGTYTLTQTTAPTGYTVADDQTVDVAAGQETTVEVVNEPEVEETGSIQLLAQDAEGNPAEGACFLLNGEGGEFGPFCDNTADDTDAEPGSVVVDSLAAGVYEAVPVPAGGETADQVTSAQQVADRRTFTVRGGQAPITVIVVIQQPVTTGDLVVIKRDDQNRPLADSCFALLSGNSVVAEICDDRRGDGDGNSGRIRFNEIEAGTYTLTEQQAPAGYEPAVDQEIEITANRVLRLTVTNTPLQVLGALTVVTVNEAGETLPGACYSLLQGSGPIGPVCDDADGLDGTTNFPELDGGPYALQQTAAPSAEYATASNQAVMIVAGETREVQVVNNRLPGSVLIRKQDENGQALGGACFALVLGDGTVAYEVCDNDANDSAPSEGRIVLANVAAGSYGVTETRTPEGYTPGADQSLTVTGNERADLLFENVPLPPPPERGNLTIFKVDGDGQLLPGACFALIDGAATIAGPRCDAADGVADGSIQFVGVGVGEYTLRETQRPAAGYQSIADQTVTIQLNQTVELVIENQLRPGRILVRKININGDLLRNACFDLEGDAEEARCTDTTGQVSFESLAPGAYRLVETQAPSGYLASAPVEGIIVNPGATTTIDVVNELAPPPPNTGSLQVVKFYCPAGEGGEGTEIIDSSNAGPSRLAQTAGCSLGNAEFNLTPFSGEGGPGSFATGDDGSYQGTMRAGDYQLVETAPDLPGDATEDVTVFVNQLTTVVVLNYVAPPEPKPAAIDIIKYTCAPGFEGTIFTDFVDACLDASNLTNNVTYRLAGPVSGRAVTGDFGQQGVTGFGQLPVGDYFLREVPPAQAITVFAFCGLDPNNPALRSVGPDIGLRLEAGQRMTCYWFNVPDDLTETTGAILVHKYACAATTYPAGFDWYEQCASQGAGVEFTIGLYDGTEFIPASAGATNRDGLLRFSRLQPGTYRLEEVGAEWCHAESDSVDARGDVVVRAGNRANVWIFNCIGTKSPPNTGAGTTAGPSPAPVPGPVAAIGITWPLLGVVGYQARRRRRAA